MGILYEMAMAAKREYLIEELTKKGVTVSQNGTDIRLCEYEELKRELVLASFREIDVEKPDNGWF